MAKEPEVPEDLRKLLEQLHAKYYGDSDAALSPPPVPKEKLVDLLRALESGREPTQAELLVGLAEDAELWHDPEGHAWATVPVGDHQEHHAIRSSAFRHWLIRRYYTQAGKLPSRQALADALTVLEGRALFDGPEHPVYVRIAGHGGKVYLDLADAAWRVVEIGPQGWQVLPCERVPVRFRRGQGMLALPEPSRGGSLRLLRRHLPLLTDADDEPAWVLTVAWLIGALSPTGPYPLLDLTGEQGSGKSTAARILRHLIDPNAVPLRSLPREERDLAISCRHGWIMAFDNLSGLGPWLSDALCRISTGGGFAPRALYQDDTQVLFSYTRPLLLTSIEGAAERPDLLDRSLVVTLPTLSDSARRPEADLWPAFEADRPAILGALLDAVSMGLQRLATAQLGHLPRMADFARWVVACEPALPWPEGTFLKVYEDNRQEAVATALESDPVGVAVCEWLPHGCGGRWQGTATDLLRLLTEHLGGRMGRTAQWPRSARCQRRSKTDPLEPVGN